MPSLSKLLIDANITPICLVGSDACEITAITADSRQVSKNALFIAMHGTKNDGTKYIADAVKQGASAVVTEPATSSSASSPPEGERGLLQQTRGGEVTHIEVPDTRAAVAALASAFYPQQPKYMFAITGTDGKTSTADFTRQLASLLGHQAASIGTLGLRSGDAARDAAFPANNTSPEPVLMHRTLQTLAQANVAYVAIEASSHGLDQKRLDGVKFVAAAFTNLTRDHLDYHGTLEAYAAAKARLFTELLPKGATAILNRDDAQFDMLNARCKARGITVKTFGYHADADFQIITITPHAGGLDAQIRLDKTTHKISLPLYGAFQLSNMLAAIGLLHSTGIALEKLVALLTKLKGVPGRLEKVATAASGAPIFVDYAHTPAALENILKTLRPHTKNKLHVVFGCGGDRDAGKRPEMGRAAVQFADHVIVTDDNPRSENPASIRDAIMQGIVTSPLRGEVARRAGGGDKAQNIADRALAIRAAVKQLHAGDVLVVAGKGHEQTQIIGAETIHFSDAEHIQQAVRNL